MEKGWKMELKWIQDGSQNRSKIGKRRKKGIQKSMKKMMRNLEASEYQNQSPLGHQRDDFGAGGEVRRGTSPSGTGDFGFDSVIPGGVRRILFHEKWSLEPRAPKGRFILLFERFRTSSKKRRLFDADSEGSKIEPERAVRRTPPPK